MESKIPRVIPTPGTRPNVQRDAHEAFIVLKSGGIVIAPNDTGYILLSCSAEGIERAFLTKQRKPGHTLGIMGTYEIHKQLHVLSPEKEDHPRITALTAATLDRTTKEDTLGIGILEAPFMRELGRLSDEDGQLIIGSSANLTGQGQKFRVQDIEPEIYNSADLVVDYGLQRYHRYRRGGTVIDINSMHLIRMGAGFEVCRERLRQFWGIEFPEDPENKVSSPIESARA